MLVEYLPILIFCILAIGVGLLPLILSYFIAPRVDSYHKGDAYECGFEAFDDARIPFDVKYYLVAILFILFDLETAFMFPWAVAFREIGWLGILSMAFFLLILTLGFVFEWMRGALEWE